MAILDIGALAGDMLKAAADTAKGHWPKIKDSVTPQFQALARIAVQIEKDKLAGKLDEGSAQALVEMQKNTLVAVTAGLHGQGKVAAQAAINAAHGVLTGAVNKAIGFALL